MSCHVSEKKKRKKTKSLLFQSNISKIRYSKKGVILNLLLDFFCPIMMKHSRKTKSRKILLPPFPLPSSQQQEEGSSGKGIDKSIVTSLF